MKHTLQYSKETDGKLRWDKDIDGTLFELYIPKWRVPEPLPETIYVEFLDYNPDTFETDARQYSNKVECGEDIKILLFYDREHSVTYRYTPNKNYYSNNWPLGKPYIPKSIIPDKPERLVIHVKWGE